jgi:hypothetical protein
MTYAAMKYKAGISTPADRIRFGGTSEQFEAFKNAVGEAYKKKHGEDSCIQFGDRTGIVKALFQSSVEHVTTVNTFTTWVNNVAKDLGYKTHAPELNGLEYGDGYSGHFFEDFTILHPSFTLSE